MATVLVIADSPQWGNLAQTLRRAGFDVVCATTGLDGLDLASSIKVDLVLGDLGLPDMSGLDVLRRLRAGQNDVPYVLLDSRGALRPTVAATRLGATDVVETSLSTVELLAALNAALERSSYRPETAGHLTNHAAARWARAVVAVIEAESDPRTLSGWASYVGMSVGALRNWCHTAKVPPKRSLDFARLLRAVIQHQRQGVRFQDALDVVDRRTLVGLLKLGGIGDAEADGSFDVADYIACQRLVSDTTAILEICTALHLPAETLRRWSHRGRVTRS